MRSAAVPLPGLVLCAALLGACERVDRPAEASATETGVMLRAEVELTLPAAPGTVGAVQAEPGAAATRTERGRVSGVLQDEAGRIVVVESDLDRIRVHSSEGDFQYGVGRSGSGPGEYRSPCCPAVGPDGRLWVRDRGNERYLAFTLGEDGASFDAELPMAHEDPGLAVAPAFDGEGRLVDVGRETDPATGRERMVRFHRGADGAVELREELPVPPLDSLGAVRIASEFSTVLVHPPFGPRLVAAHGPGGAWATALSSRYTVAWRKPDGRRLTLSAPESAGPPVPGEERARAEERLREILEALDADPTELGLQVPERQPPLDELLFDDEGRLWVSLLMPDGEPRKAHVYGPDGGRRATVRWPAGIALSREGLGGEHALGVAREGGEERVVRLRLRVAEERDTER